MTNDLSNQLRLLNTFEWMARPATTKQICFDAADHIEKLEAALTHIWAWYPISVAKPHETIDAIKDYAFAAIKGENKND
jgi:hypothetical protein